MRVKEAVARAFDWTGTTRAMFAAQKAFLRPLIRILNYHDVPPGAADTFERHLDYYREHFEPVGLDELRDLLAGRSRLTRPGLAITFDDSSRSQFEVAAPLLERYGFPGWFFVTPGFVDCEASAQREYARVHSVEVEGSGHERLALSWDEVRALDRAHIVGCHGMNHVRLSADLSDDELRVEIRESRRVIEERLGHPVDAFCWVGGEEESYSAAAARMIVNTGYRYAFMTNSCPVRPGADPLHLQRTNISAWDSLEMVHFQLSGAMDLYYLPKRRRVNRVTAVARAGIAATASLTPQGGGGARP